VASSIDRKVSAFDPTLMWPSLSAPIGHEQAVRWLIALVMQCCDPWQSRWRLWLRYADQSPSNIETIFCPQHRIRSMEATTASKAVSWAATASTSSYRNQSAATRHRRISCTACVFKGATGGVGSRAQTGLTGRAGPQHPAWHVPV